MTYPAEKYPKVLLGFSLGPWRWERHIDDRRDDLPSDDYTPGGFLFSRDRSGENWGLPTQQYESWAGFSILKPYALNLWIQFRKQRFNSEGDRVPGSELVKYIRFALWRWDPWGTGSLHWIKNSVYLNFSRHWD